MYILPAEIIAAMEEKVNRKFEIYNNSIKKLRFMTLLNLIIY